MFRGETDWLRSCFSALSDSPSARDDGGRGEVSSISPGGGDSGDPWLPRGLAGELAQNYKNP